MNPSPKFLFKYNFGRNATDNVRYIENINTRVSYRTQLTCLLAVNKVMYCVFVKLSVLTTCTWYLAGAVLQRSAGRRDQESA